MTGGTDTEQRPPGKRELHRRKLLKDIRTIGRRQLAEVGPVTLSTRAITRELGMASSAFFRYYPSKEALLTALIEESYGDLAERLEAVDGPSPAETWLRRANELRRWALESPHDFQLIYGTPIPGYAAPPETIPLAERVARCFLDLAPANPASPVEAVLATQLAPIGGDRAAPVLAALSQMIGALTLELGGHFTGTADPADHLWTHVVHTQIRSLGMDSAEPRHPGTRP
ncbi:TetR/AcrR family transcriptional regulator [Corynebacterium freneyi]|uniref:TetR/AcrR family transcriptional regulator n=1 Tax=Corynebacterium freneyi TaxID=134034 RepID=UPI00254FA985|nr:TetR/AcrR family transcriptional regulator [Corynebacterium freneyi]MDK8769203.1 TetR/AcrR family transcriptional regulator [Corynebacterium freneyi]